MYKSTVPVLSGTVLSSLILILIAFRYLLQLLYLLLTNIRCTCCRIKAIINVGATHCKSIVNKADILHSFSLNVGEYLTDTLALLTYL